MITKVRRRIADVRGSIFIAEDREQSNAEAEILAASVNTGYVDRGFNGDEAASAEHVGAHLRPNCPRRDRPVLTWNQILETGGRLVDATVADDFGARHDALAEHFSLGEILEITGIAINAYIWTRLMLAEGATLGLAEQALS